MRSCLGRFFLNYVLVLCHANEATKVETTLVKRSQAFFQFITGGNVRPLRFVLSSYFPCNEMSIFFLLRRITWRHFEDLQGITIIITFLSLSFIVIILLLLLSLTFHFLAGFFLTTLSKGLEFERSPFRAMNWWCKSMKSICCFNFF